MKLIETNNEQLNSFVKSQEKSQFLQSFEWGEFQKAYGDDVLRFGIEEGGKIIFAFSVLAKNLFFGKRYFYSPRIDLGILNEAQRGYLFAEIKKNAEKKNAIFWRLEPTGKSIVNCQLSIVKTLDVQASKTSILDIQPALEELLKAMHQKTRYNIRLAEKKGVKTRAATADDFEKFWEIMNETKERDGFRLHSKSYYEKMLRLPFIELIVAEHEGEVIAANIVSYFGDMASYLHGSSSDKQRNVMAPYLIQWETIKRAKEKGCKYYDFNGISETKWPGVTRFKRGFGGEDVVYSGAFDLLFVPAFYQVYQMMRLVRRLMGKLLKI